MRKRALGQSLRRLITHHQRNISNTRRDLRSLSRVNMRDAIYIVHIEEQINPEDTYDVEQRKTTTEYRGSLSAAIKAAEKEFVEEHHLEDYELQEMPTKYTGQIRLGNRTYYIPEKEVDKILGSRKTNSE